MSNNKNTGGVFGKGYYIALILCAAAIGIAGFLYYQNASDTETALQEQEVNASEPAALQESEQDVAVVATQPQAATATEGTQATTAPTEKRTMKTTAPVSGETVASYAMDCLSYNETTRDWRVHNGVDIAAKAGTQVMAAADGTVYTTYQDETMGYTVVIRHDGGYTTKYSSLDENIQVQAGDEVKLGDVIGCVGSSALLENAIGDHVHFSVLCNDEVMDPAEFLSLGE